MSVNEETSISPNDVMLQDNQLRFAAENYLITEAELLDTWQLDKWFALWAAEGDLAYEIPSTDQPDADPDVHLMFVRDDRFLLRQRVRSTMNGTNWAENPRSTLRRMVSNVTAVERADGSFVFKCNFVVYRSQEAVQQIFPGHSIYQLERGGEYGFVIRHKRSVLDLQELRPHGRVAFIL
ncbi:MAG: aromatic-ring-hydroxylating dioxygenase subunit beta [Pseudomonadales bacterium]|nr:aromatic-ring-hydroxylating dioxygenase subunit beta [Pseudomonadales bacterium]